MTDIITIGERIAALRRLRGLSQSALGSIIGRSRSSIAQIETGGMKPDYEFIRDVVKNCNSTYEYIFGDVIDPERIKNLSGIDENESDKLKIFELQSNEEREIDNFKSDYYTELKQKASEKARLKFEKLMKNKTASRINDYSDTDLEKPKFLRNEELTITNELFFEIIGRLEKIEVTIESNKSIS